MTQKIEKDSLKAWALGIRPTSLAGALMTVQKVRTLEAFNAASACQVK